jgi:GNAT superfamily N-acetyltransferase
VNEPRFRFEPLGSHHDRAAFSCGVESLDRYLQRQARQDVDRGIAAVTVMVDSETELIAGYYSLSASSVQPIDLPESTTRKLPNYPSLPAILIGRLALDERFHGQGLGELLLLNALGNARRLTAHIGAIAVIVDAIDDRARRFYEHFGFVRLASNEYRLAIGMKAVDRL